MLGIDNYTPIFYTDSAQLVANEKEKLTSLIGQRIKEIWVAWEQEENYWFNSLPVIFILENCQLELCAYQSEVYAITFNQINVDDSVDFFGAVKWEKDKLKQLNLTSYINQEVISIEIMEPIVEPISGVKCEYDTFGVGGIGFSLEKGYLAVCNGFDENRFIYERKYSCFTYKYTKI
ncbi:hypothetical protein [Sutcliffiella halmapala]|uniref:hypothetical protein n=1 Tax=Sutcliffiella halmapala TaxID=79882 RepID=UPI000995ABEB|nr:hypothetical protein [Sutcliffiella halmapala]